MAGKEFYPAWRLELAEPDEDGIINATPQGWPGDQPDGLVPLLVRTGVKGEYFLYSAVDRTDPVTDEVTFKPEIITHLHIPCPICGDDAGLVIVPPIKRPDRLPPLIDARTMRRMKCWCRECERLRHKASLAKVREKTKQKGKE